MSNYDKLEDFVQLMIKEHPDYKNRIIDLYQLCIDEIWDGASKENEIELCISSIKELINVQ